MDGGETTTENKVKVYKFRVQFSFGGDSHEVGGGRESIIRRKEV